MLKELLAQKDPKCGNVKFIAIDGHGGSGKSSLSKLLAEKLGAEIIQTDDFAGWEEPIEWWPNLIERVFRPIANGVASLNYPRSKWWPNHHPTPVIDQPVTSIIILEGVTALRKEFRPYISLGIYVDTPRDICLQRGIERDLTSDTGKTKEEITRMWEAWAADEDDYIKNDNPKAYADIVVDGTKSFNEQIKGMEILS